MERRYLTKKDVDEAYGTIPDGVTLIIDPFIPRETRIIGDLISIIPSKYKGAGGVLEIEVLRAYPTNHNQTSFYEGESIRVGVAEEHIPSSIPNPENPPIIDIHVNEGSYFGNSYVGYPTLETKES